MGPRTTSRTSAAPARRERRALPRHVAGFTLIELIVAMAIIVILMSIVAPLILRSYRNGRLARLAADLQMVSTALDAYKTDFGDYPRIPTWPAVGLPAVAPAPIPGEPIPNTGAAILGKALMGGYGDGLMNTGNPGAPDQADPPLGQPIAYPRGTAAKNNNNNPNDPANPPRWWVAIANLPPQAPNFTDTKQWAFFNVIDGADGPGFRTQKTIDLNGDGIADVGGGKVWGPYLQADAIKVSGTYLLDHEGNPILYFPTKPGKSILTRLTTNANEAQPYVDRFPLAANAPPAHPSINANNNFEAYRRDPTEPDATVLTRIRLMMGDYDANGAIADQNVPPYFGPETALDKSYILVSAGLDTFYGPTTVGAAGTQAGYDTNRDAAQDCDDVINK